MKATVSLLGLCAVLANTPALAWERIFLAANKATENWRITIQDLGFRS